MALGQDRRTSRTIKSSSSSSNADCSVILSVGDTHGRKARERRRVGEKGGCPPSRLPLSGPSSLHSVRAVSGASCAAWQYSLLTSAMIVSYVRTGRKQVSEPGRRGGKRSTPAAAAHSRKPPLAMDTHRREAQLDFVFAGLKRDVDSRPAEKRGGGGRGGGEQGTAVSCVYIRP